MKINKDGININNYDLYLNRYCVSCENKYKIIDSFSNKSHFYKPYDYIKGCSEYCLHCWLLLDDKPDSNLNAENDKTDIVIKLNLTYPSNHNYWYNEDNYQEIDLGNLELAYKDYIIDDFHLVILPISRLVIHRSIFLSLGTMIYPEGRLDFSSLNLENLETSELLDEIPQELSSKQLSSLQSQLSDISIETLNEYSLIVMPVSLEWETLSNATHEEHLELIYNISEKLDSVFLNYIKYMNCKISYLPNNQLPSSASQTNVNNMSTALFINTKTNNAKLISGSVFSHQITKGMGLVMAQPEWNNFPKKGAVGQLVSHALILYNQIIQTQSATARFVQILSLLEFLAFPTVYKPFKEVKKVITRYIEGDSSSKAYKDILNRFEELTGKKDKTTGEELGLRTNIVHLGKHLEELVPSFQERKKLFEELDEYIRCVIDHMIMYSNLSMQDYEVEKSKLLHS